MPINTSEGGLRHIKNLANMCLERGAIEVELETKADALRMRQGFNYMRTKERKKTAKIYQPDDAKYSSSDFDCIETKMYRRGALWILELRVVDNVLKELTIRDLATGEVITPEEL